MTSPPRLLVAAALLLAALPSRADETRAAHRAPFAGWDGKPHGRAPLHVSLEITEEAWLRAPREDWFFERLAAEHPGRFEKVPALLEVDGESYAGWRDLLGEYELRYDADEEEVASWQRVPADLLTRGRQDFVQFCSSCHGLEGDGYGRSAQHLRPPPRDFRQGLFKFAKTPEGKLPTDGVLRDLVKRGLDGTPMYRWALSDEQLSEILQYVKSLSPEGTGFRDVYAEFAEKVEIGSDPFARDPAAGVARGKVVYHAIGCYNCHPGYATPAEIDALLTAEGKTPQGSYRGDLTYSRVDSPSSYAVLGHPVMILPPDFTFHTMRFGATAQEVAETVAAGIPGANMPTWKGSIPDRDIWAVGYFIRDLVERYRSRPAERAAFLRGLRGDA